MSLYVTLDEAAKRLGLSRTEVRELRSLSFVNDPRGARVLEADVARIEEEHEREARETELRAERRPVNLAAKIADEEAWLTSIRAQGGKGLALDDKEAELERDKAKLEQYKAKAAHLDAARWGGEEYARMCDEYEVWLKEKRALLGSSAGPWLERAERRAREERTQHAKARAESAR